MSGTYAMTRTAWRRGATALAIAISSCGLAVPAFAAPTESRSPPDRVLAANLSRDLEAALGRHVASKRLPGGVMIVLKDGRPLTTVSAGWSDIDARIPAGPKTIYLLFSVSKVLTAVGTLMLVDDGKIALDDPIARYMPEFADPRVWVSGEGAAMVTEAAKRPVTVRDLLAQRGGYTYGAFHAGPVKAEMLAQGLNLSPFSGTALSLGDYAGRLARIPLLFQPGQRWEYGPSADLLGALIERVSGRSFETYMATRLFGPLGMKDTAFFVEPRKRRREAVIYDTDTGDRLVPAPGMVNISVDAAGHSTLVPVRPDASRPPIGAVIASGAAGISSTADDLARFVAMLADGGTYAGHRFLKASTVAAMGTSQVPRGKQDWGLGVGIDSDPARVASRGSLGTFGWNGAGQSEIWIDRATGLSGVFVSNVLGKGPPEDLRTIVFADLHDGCGHGASAARTSSPRADCRR